MPETTEQLTRIAAHIPCLDRAAQDPAASPEVRARIALMASLARSAVGVAGPSRTVPAEVGQPRTEATR